jgi:16S rRNA (cytidine1402-2'-O)-methyltransferase
LRDAGEPYTVIPGACAFVAGLVLSALPADKFAFLGFLPDKAGEKRALLEKYKDCDLTLIFHSAPQDIDKNLAAMYEVFGERKAAAVREITKIHEESVTFHLSEGLQGDKRGEYVLLVEGAKQTRSPLCDLSEKEHIRHYMTTGLDKKEALKRAAKDRGVSKSELYPFSIDL